MLRWLAGQGLRPLLLDWGTPGPAEAAFDLGRYGAERLVPALAEARRLAGRPVPVIGYCMGGTLAVGLAARGRTTRGTGDHRRALGLRLDRGQCAGGCVR